MLELDLKEACLALALAVEELGKALVVAFPLEVSLAFLVSFPYSS